MADDMKDEEPDRGIRSESAEGEQPDEDGRDENGGTEMPWEAAATSTVHDVAESAEFDLASGTVTLEYEDWGNYKDPRYDRRQFSDLNEVREALEEIGESVMIGRVPWEDGPVFSTNASAIVDRALEVSGIAGFFDTRRVPEQADLLFGIADGLDTRLFRPVRVDLEEIDAALIERLAQRPELMYQMDPRKFEELLAELFRGRGYEAELTPPSRDGGRDLMAFRKEPFGTLLTLVQAKRYGPDHRVGVRVVRELYGVIEHGRASHGVVATTSSFTKPARTFHEQLTYRLSLADFDRLVEWLQEHKRRR